MTETEEQDLRALGAAIAKAEQSPWEPRCVCKAFASAPGALVLTLQGWIDLDAARSPLLEGKGIDADDAEGQLTAAVNAFGLGPLLTEPEDRDTLVEAMLDAVHAAFSTHLKMRCPGESRAQAPGGFGKWLPILACLVAQLGMSRPEALATPVIQALALIAAHRSNQGWTVADLSYAQRDMEEEAI